MIYLVIGPSCAGKSTLVKQRILKDKEFNTYKDITWLTETDDTILFGKYTKTKEREKCGVDTIAYQEQGETLQKQVSKCMTMGKNIVLEGFKVASSPLIDYIIEHHYSVTIIYVYCSLETSIQRNKNNNSKASDRSLKIAYSRCENFYNKYKDKVKVIYISTDKKDMSKVEFGKRFET